MSFEKRRNIHDQESLLSHAKIIERKEITFKVVDRVCNIEYAPWYRKVKRGILFGSLARGGDECFEGSDADVLFLCESFFPNNRDYEGIIEKLSREINNSMEMVERGKRFPIRPLFALEEWYESRHDSQFEYIFKEIRKEGIPIWSK